MIQVKKAKNRLLAFLRARTHQEYKRAKCVAFPVFYRLHCLSQKAE